jgi:hypothetical protein
MIPNDVMSDETKMAGVVKLGSVGPVIGCIITMLNYSVHLYVMSVWCHAGVC